MAVATFFRRTYRDPVVEYYFLPGRRDIRLTVRFGDVLIHQEYFQDGNRIWKQESCRFSNVFEAEVRALEILSASESDIANVYRSSLLGKCSSRLVQESSCQYSSAA
jgi:hypothetical protein